MRASSARSASLAKPRPSGLAPVVDLSVRRPVNPVGAGADEDQVALTYEHWAGFFRRAGIDVGAPQAPETVIPLLCAELERLVGGLLILREGNEEIEADDQRGVDLPGALAVTGLLRDLKAATAIAAARTAQAEPELPSDA